MTKTGRAELYDLPVIGGSVASHRDVGRSVLSDGRRNSRRQPTLQLAGVGFEPTTSGL